MNRSGVRQWVRNIAVGVLVTAWMAAVVVLARPPAEHRASDERAQPAGMAASVVLPEVSNVPTQAQDEPADPPESSLASEDAPDASVDAPAAPRPIRASNLALEQLVTQGRKANEHLAETNEQLAETNAQLAQMRQDAADQEAQQEDNAQEEAAQHEATLDALDTLREAGQLLTTGDSDGVDEKLARAEEALSGRTLLDVEGAREALQREDLFQAREYLSAALAQRRW